MTKSPFKFLDPYERSDKAVFFGRDAEVDDLYRMVFQTNLVLVYGTSGTGKTSLIQCGLANRFQPSDWFDLFVRREADINVSLDQAIRARAATEIADNASVVEAIQSLYLDHLRPIYLIFDQFEELFILGSDEEQKKFFDSVAALIAAKVSCKIIISMREEYLAKLHHFEQTVPTLFDKRLRVEPMSMANVEEVIIGSTAAHNISLENGAVTARKIIDNLDDTRVGVQLAYLQVYLDKLYHLATEPGDTKPVTFTDADVAAAGKLGDIMADFLADQKTSIQKQLETAHDGVDPKAAQTILEAFVSVEGTKRPTSRAELAERIPALEPVLDDALMAFQSARILRISDNRAELAHDSLAKHIAAMRSEERKGFVMIEEMVRNQLRNSEVVKQMSKSKRAKGSRLGDDELATVRLCRNDLQLSEAEAEFIEDSERQASKEIRWKRLRLAFVALFLGIAALVSIIFAVSAGLSESEAEVAREETQFQLASALSNLDELTYNEMTSLQNLKGAGTEEARKSFITAASNSYRNSTIGTIFERKDDDKYWNKLLVADQHWNAMEYEKAAAGFRELLDVERKLLADDPWGLSPRVRKRMLLWRLKSVIYNTDKEYANVINELLDLSVEPKDVALTIWWPHDTTALCDELKSQGSDSKHCKNPAVTK